MYSDHTYNHIYRFIGCNDCDEKCDKQGVLKYPKNGTKFKYMSKYNIQNMFQLKRKDVYGCGVEKVCELENSLPINKITQHVTKKTCHQTNPNNFLFDEPTDHSDDHYDNQLDRSEDHKKCQTEKCSCSGGNNLCGYNVSESNSSSSNGSDCPDVSDCPDGSTGGTGCSDDQHNGSNCPDCPEDHDCPHKHDCSNCHECSDDDCPDNDHPEEHVCYEEHNHPDADDHPEEQNTVCDSMIWINKPYQSLKCEVDDSNCEKNKCESEIVVIYW